MEKQQQPLGPGDVRKLLNDLRENKLGAEIEGRLIGRLLVDDDLVMAFGSAIDEELAKGDAGRPAIPPVPFRLRRPRVVEFTQPPVFGPGIIEGFSWETVKAWRGLTANRLQPIAAAACEAARSAASSALDTTRVRMEWVAERLADAEQFRADLDRRLRVSLSNLPLAAVGPHLGPEKITIQCADAQGQATGGPITLDPRAGDVEQAPIITADGAFRLTVSSDHRELAGHRLIAILRLVEFDAIHFQADLDAVGGRHRAEFHADGLPAPPREMVIPWDQITLVAVPADPDPAAA